MASWDWYHTFIYVSKFVGTLDYEKYIVTTFTIWLQVDAAQGAEDMVEHLTEKTLEQEEKITELEEEKGDLVKLHALLCFLEFLFRSMLIYKRKK